MNASPAPVDSPPKSYPPLAYAALKAHPLGLRSVLNDDLEQLLAGTGPGTSAEGGIGGGGLYLMKYSKPPEMRLPGGRLRYPGRATSDFNYNLLGLGANEDGLTEVDLLGLRGVRGLPNITGQDGSLAVESQTNPVWTTWKSRRKKGVEKVTKHCIDYILYAPSTATLVDPEGLFRDIPRSLGTETGPSGEKRAVHAGVVPLGALELLQTSQVGPGYLPSASYPSDHIAIAADFEVVTFTTESGDVTTSAGADDDFRKS